MFFSSALFFFLSIFSLSLISFSLHMLGLLRLPITENPNWRKWREDLSPINTESKWSSFRYGLIQGLNALRTHCLSLPLCVLLFFCVGYKVKGQTLAWVRTRKWWIEHLGWHTCLRKEQHEVSAFWARLWSIHKDSRARSVASIEFRKHSGPTEGMRRRLRWKEQYFLENNKIAVRTTTYLPEIIRARVKQMNLQESDKYGLHARFH